MTNRIYRITFQVTGANKFGADTGILSLLKGDSLVVRSSGFSGGLKSPVGSKPIPTETYHINLSIRQAVSAYKSPPDTPEAMHHWYGIEKIDAPEWQFEWGNYRAALNEPKQGMAQDYRGNFLHGKVRDDDYTHGCICERSEVVLKMLWGLPADNVVAVKVVR